MNLRNKVFLIGNVGVEPEIKTFENGELANLVVATNETYRNKNGERVDNTEWHRITVFGKGQVAVVRDYIHKGKEIALEGKLVTRSWETQDGDKRYTTEVVANEILLLGGRKPA